MKLQKTPKAITDAARGEECTLHIVGYCRYETDTTVYCHFPDGTGGSNKLTGPISGGFGCGICHGVIDGRISGRAVTGEDREFYMRRSTNRTNIRLIELGLVSVKGLS